MRALLFGLGGGVLSAVVIGIPTDVLPNPWFTRMTPVRPLDVVFWSLTSVLLGALAATASVRSEGREGTVGAGSGVLGVLAAGCPVCNKLVVALLGTSGALSTFAPLQPAIGAAGLLLAGGALVVRLRALRRASCPAPVAVERSVLGG